MKASDQAPRNSRNGPRIEARKSKLRSLTPEQTAALKRWLFLEKVTYQEAIQRMAVKFGIKLWLNQMSAFWNQHCQPVPQSESTPAMLDVVIQSSEPVRLTINRNGAGVAITIAHNGKI